MKIKEDIERKFLISKAGVLCLRRRIGTLRRIGDWSGTDFTIDFFGNLKSKMLSLDKLNYIKKQYSK